MFQSFKCQIYSFMVSLNSFFLLLFERNDTTLCSGHKRRSLHVRMGTCVHRGGSYNSLRYRGAWELLLELVESGLLLGILFRVGPLYSSFRDCCFAVVKRANESLLFVSLILVGSEELLICCCQSLVELGQLVVLLKWVGLWCLNYRTCVCKQTFRLRVTYIFCYLQLLRPIEYWILSIPNSQNTIFYGNILVWIEHNSMFLHGEVFFLTLAY